MPPPAPEMPPNPPPIPAAPPTPTPPAPPLPTFNALHTPALQRAPPLQSVSRMHSTQFPAAWSQSRPRPVHSLSDWHLVLQMLLAHTRPATQSDAETHSTHVPVERSQILPPVQSSEFRHGPPLAAPL